jgi:hypothetical protein
MAKKHPAGDCQEQPNGRTAVWSATAIVSGDTAAEMGCTARWGC